MTALKEKPTYYFLLYAAFYWLLLLHNFNETLIWIGAIQIFTAISFVIYFIMCVVLWTTFPFHALTPLFRFSTFIYTYFWFLIILGYYLELISIWLASVIIKKSKYVVKDIISFLLHFHCMFMCTKNNEKSPLRTQTY